MLDFFISFLTFLEVSCALLLIVVILMQRSKSGGGLGAIGGGATEEMFGSSAGNVLTKTTVFLSIFFFVNTLAMAVLQGNALQDKNVSIVEQADDTDAQLFGIEEGEEAAAKSAEKLTGTNEVAPEAAKSAPPKGSNSSQE